MYKVGTNAFSVFFFFFSHVLFLLSKGSPHSWTHQGLHKLSIQYQAILLCYGNSPSLTVKLLPPVCASFLKKCISDRNWIVGKFFISFNIWDIVTEFIRVMVLLGGNAFLFRVGFCLEHYMWRLTGFIFDMKDMKENDFCLWE